MTIDRFYQSENNRQLVTVEVWSKGSLFRSDEDRRGGALDEGGVGGRRISCRNCERKGYTLSTVQGGLPGTVFQVQFTPLNNSVVDATDGLRFDWMRLGLLHGDIPMYLREPADSTLHSFSKSQGVVQEVDHEGHRCLAIRVTTKSGDVRRSYFRPDLGMNPVLFADDISRGGMKFRQETKITYKKYAGVDIWFPKTVSHIRTQGDKTILSESIVIDQAELNTSVADNVFTLAGLGLDFGQPVAFPELKSANDHPTWGKDGLDWKQTIGKSTREAYEQAMRQTAPPPPTPDNSPSSNRRLYYTCALVLASTAIWIAAVLVRRRRAQNSGRDP
jgi:hypothetical protein